MKNKFNIGDKVTDGNYIFTVESMLLERGSIKYTSGEVLLNWFNENQLELYKEKKKKRKKENNIIQIHL